MISIGYQYKAHRKTIDRVARTVDTLRMRYPGLDDLNITCFFTYSIEQALDFAEQEPWECADDLREYLKRQKR